MAQSSQPRGVFAQLLGSTAGKLAAVAALALVPGGLAVATVLLGAQGLVGAAKAPPGSALRGGLSSITGPSPALGRFANETARVARHVGGRRR